MAEPTTYTPDFDFTATDKGTEINVELQNISESTESLAAAISDVRRSDGALQNGIVTADSLTVGLKDELASGAISQAAASATSAAGSASAAATSASAADADATAAAASAAAASTDANDAAASAAAAAATLDSSLKKADNLSDLANAATARGNLGSTTVGDAVFIAANAGAAQTALGVPPNARTISAGTGLTGGGDLSADRTISASIASQAQAEAGTATDVLMTPQRTEQHMLANALGWSQTWQDLTGSRAVATSYQNTTGRPIMVAIEPSGPTVGQFEVSTDNATWVRLGIIYLDGQDIRQGAWVVPPEHYYRQTAGSFTFWSELR